MIDLNSQSVSLTMQVPQDLLRELRQMASDTQISVEELVREACIAYVEPHIWEKQYQTATQQSPIVPTPGTSNMMSGALDLR